MYICMVNIWIAGGSRGRVASQVILKGRWDGGHKGSASLPPLAGLPPSRDPQLSVYLLEGFFVTKQQNHLRAAFPSRSP